MGGSWSEVLLGVLDRNLSRSPSKEHGATVCFLRWMRLRRGALGHSIRSMMPPILALVSLFVWQICVRTHVTKPIRERSRRSVLIMT